ncbi:UNVERIFIED_CONTAM: hypothetical protein HDU68_007465 [Siphonaria sp. JEL0065]|nr:hypothetical protein HDU68_007465 [Siphonaria sp. JEL0065]
MEREFDAVFVEINETRFCVSSLVLGCLPDSLLSLLFPTGLVPFYPIQSLFAAPFDPLFDPQSPLLNLECIEESKLVIVSSCAGLDPEYFKWLLGQVRSFLHHKLYPPMHNTDNLGRLDSALDLDSDSDSEDEEASLASLVGDSDASSNNASLEVLAIAYPQPTSTQLASFLVEHNDGAPPRTPSRNSFHSQKAEWRKSISTPPLPHRLALDSTTTEGTAANTQQQLPQPQQQLKTQSEDRSKVGALMILKEEFDFFVIPPTAVKRSEQARMENTTESIKEGESFGKRLGRRLSEKLGLFVPSSLQSKRNITQLQQQPQQSPSVYSSSSSVDSHQGDSLWDATTVRQKCAELLKEQHLINSTFTPTPSITSTLEEVPTTATRFQHAHFVDALTRLTNLNEQSHLEWGFRRVLKSKAGSLISVSVLDFKPEVTTKDMSIATADYVNEGEATEAENTLITQVKDESDGLTNVSKGFSVDALLGHLRMGLPLKKVWWESVFVVVKEDGSVQFWQGDDSDGCVLIRLWTRKLWSVESVSVA